MSQTGWQTIWSQPHGRQLWSVPDPQIEQLADRWKQAGDIRRVLDIGCGPGRHVQLLARLGFEVYGMDDSPAAIDACRGDLASQGMSARIWLGPMNEIPHPDGYFDAILAYNSIYHAPENTVQATMRLIRSKLRAGGVCFATFPSRQSRLYGRGQSIGPHTFITTGLYNHLLPGGGESGVTHHFSDEAEIRDWFEGFSIDSLQHQEFSIPSQPDPEGPIRWTRIPKAYFWRVLARRMADHDAA